MLGHRADVAARLLAERLRRSRIVAANRFTAV
jgi:hypothetical protein